MKILGLATLLLAQAAAAMEPPMNAGELAHALDRLGKTGRVLYVAAHPDDENTRLLAYLANHRHLEVAYLSMTRGGGGQNLIGREQSELLDVIRTEELLAARRLDGAQQRFTMSRDFGFSKSADETFGRWGKEQALGDVVWVIRTFQPDVIVTRFDEEPPNHGHHTASAILAREAFAAAADPKRFPEQLAGGVTVWKATRLLRNIPNWRDAPPPPKEAIELDVGAYDARLGIGYGELAALSRSQHKSQGFGVPGDRGPVVERLLPLAGTPPKADLLDGIDLGWSRFGARAAPFAKAVDEARAALDRDHPERALPALARAHAALDGLPDEPRVRDARVKLARIIAAAAGVFVRATAARPVAVPGSTVEIAVELVARLPAAVVVRRVELPGAAAVDINEPLTARRVVTVPVALPADAAISTPYWLAEPAVNGRYTVRDKTLIGRPRAPAALTATVDILVADRVVRLPAPVVHSWTDPVHGERVRDFLVAPPATVTPARDAVMFPEGRAAPVLVRVRAAADGVKGDVDLGLPAGWRAAPATQPVTLAKAGDETTVRFEVTPPAGSRAAVSIHPAFLAGGQRWSFREDTIDHPHIPLQLVLQPAALRLVPLSIKLPSGLVGYVAGSGDSVAEDLAHVGVKVVELDEPTLRSGDLSRYSAIVIGIRAYNTRPVVRSSQPRLLEYVEKGGVVVAQYNTNNRLQSLDNAIGPFPLEIGRDRITDETAKVELVDPASKLLRAPNAIGPADFDGWVQERGIYFGAKWDDRYKPLFKMSDPGEQPLLGSVLVAKHGKGRFIYTGLVFFRELPAGVPGAYRLFANLIAR